MAEVRKYEDYEKVMKVIDRLSAINKRECDEETNMVIYLITLYPKVVTKYVTDTLNVTLNILNISVSNYVPMVIDNAVSKWTTDKFTLDNDKGKLEAFLTVLNNETDEVLNNYILLYNFYKVLYDITLFSLPEYVNTDEWRRDDEDDYPLHRLEDFIPDVISNTDKDDDYIYSILSSDYNKYCTVLSIKYDIELYNLFINKIKNVNSNLINLEDNIIDIIKRMDCLIEMRNLDEHDDALYNTISHAIYNSIISYALVSLHEEKDNMLLLILDNTTDISAGMIITNIIRSIKSISGIVANSIKSAGDEINNMLNSLKESAFKWEKQ